MDDYGRFYRETRSRIINYLMRMTGEGTLALDIMQETFVRHLDCYGRANRDVALLYGIARNLFLDEKRRDKKQAALAGVRDARPAVDQERHLAIRDEYRGVLAAMAALEEGEREILSLAAGGDLSYAEIASLAGISEANVKVKVHRARLKLRRLLKEEEK